MQKNICGNTGTPQHNVFFAIGAIKFMAFSRGRGVGLSWTFTLPCAQYKRSNLTGHLHCSADRPTSLPPPPIYCPTWSHSLWRYHHSVTPSHFQLKISDRSFHLKAPAIWNSLPAHLRQPTSPTPSNGLGLLALSRQQFLAQLKTHLFHQSFPPGSQ